MKVLMICGSLYPAQTGGVDNSVYWQSKSLFKNGVEVQLISTNSGIAKDRVQENVWINTDFGLVKYVNIFSKRFPVEWIIKTFPLLITYKGYLHFHSLTYCAPFLFLIPVLKNKIIWSIHGELDEQALIYSKWKKKPILWVLKKFMLSKILFHTTSPEETKRAQIILGNNAKIVEVANFLELPDKEVRNSNEKYFLYIGRIHPKKAIENLIAALSKSNIFLNSDFILKIAGDSDSDYGEMLKELVSDLNLSNKIIFLGHIGSEGKQMLYANAYFTFMPSHTENFGNVVIESLAQGTPVVASKGTPWQILRDRKAGFWVENEVSSLASVINKIIDLNIEEYNALRENARQLAYEEFNIDSNIEKWITTYQSL